MPWKILRNSSDEWCVHKVSEETGEAESEPLVCHPSREAALSHMRALYANVEEMGERSLNQRLEQIHRAFEEQFGGQMEWYISEVFEGYVIVGNLEDQKFFRVDYEYDETNERYRFALRGQWQEVERVYMPVTSSEVTAAETVANEQVESVIVSEFRGGFPQVPPAPGVNLKALTEGDPSPMFLTVPVSRIGAVSKNGLVHDREFAESLVAQINRDRPGGLMGHLRDDERGTAFPTSSIHWIGAILQDDTVWAKGYIPKTKPEVREEYRIAKAKGGQVATSVYGRAVKEFENGKQNRWRARDFVLETIDLAPYNRAALPGTREYELTAEMAAQEGDNSMADKQSIIAELTVDDLPEQLRQEVIKQHLDSERIQGKISELTGERDALAEKVAELTSERDQLAQRVAELEEQERVRKEEEERQQFDLALTAKIAELISWEGDERAKASCELLRSQLKRAVLAEIGSERTPAVVEEAIKKLWEREFQTLAEILRDSLAGPAAAVAAKPTGLRVDESEQAILAARAKFGI